MNYSHVMKQKFCKLIFWSFFFFLFFYYRVIDGFEVLDDLEKLPVNPKTFRPLTDKRINSVTIHANPLATEEIFSKFTE